MLICEENVRGEDLSRWFPTLGIGGGLTGTINYRMYQHNTRRKLDQSVHYKKDTGTHSGIKC
jgi:hypothetical protein